MKIKSPTWRECCCCQSARAADCRRRRATHQFNHAFTRHDHRMAWQRLPIGIEQTARRWPSVATVRSFHLRFQTAYRLSNSERPDVPRKLGRFNQTLHRRLRQGKFDSLCQSSRFGKSAAGRVDSENGYARSAPASAHLPAARQFPAFRQTTADIKEFARRNGRRPGSCG